jgi:imidazoleglycerol-phosphate dehydratase
VHVPLDEVLVQAAVDLSGRPYVVHDEPATLAPFIGGTGPLFPTSLTRHRESLGHAARITLHVVVVRASRPGAQPTRTT